MRADIRRMAPTQELAASEDVFVARQPIFRRNLQVYGYELLYRSSTENAFDGTVADSATVQVITNAFLTIGADKLLNQKPGFINLDESLLKLEIPKLLPLRSVVIEILESVQPTPEVRRVCQDLKRLGYTLALDDVSDDSEIDPWVDIVDILKIDFLKTSEAKRKQFIERYRRGRMKLLAEKLESKAEFLLASSLGYDYYQGFFFARPEIVCGRTIPESQLHLIRLLREVSAEDPDIGRLEKLVAQELGLTYKLLRYLNSGAFAWRTSIKSVRHALALLGADELRTWLSLLLFTSLGRPSTAHVMTNSLVRARFAELLAPQMHLGQRKSSAFLLGLFSQLDAILNCPLDYALAELPLEQDIQTTLLERPSRENRLSYLYGLIRSYEAADWVRCAAIAEQYDITIPKLSGTYVEAVNWADTIAAL